VLSASTGKLGREALQLLPNRFRKPEVLLHLPLIINSEDQSKMEMKKILTSRSLGVKAFDVSKSLAFTGTVGLFL